VSAKWMCDWRLERLEERLAKACVPGPQRPRWRWRNICYRRAGIRCGSGDYLLLISISREVSYSRIRKAR
jgi:hypothetical protein